MFVKGQKPACVAKIKTGKTLIIVIIYELHHEKTRVAYAKTKAQISCVVTVQLISELVFPTQIKQSLFFLNPKFQASNHLLWLHGPVRVRPGQKP